MILGLPVPVFWIWFSAIVYIIAIILFLPALRKEKSELMVAFFAFLAGMAWLHIFLGAGVYWKQMLLSHLGFLGGLIGVVYTLKFPLTAIAESARRPLFNLAILLALAIVGWMLIFPHQFSTMIWVSFLYMIITAGILAGGYMIWKGWQMEDIGSKIKGVGGGAGLLTCCLVADVFVLYTLVVEVTLGVVIGEFFMWLAPIILIVALYLGRAFQKPKSTI